MRIYEANSDASSTRVTALEQKPIRPEASLESILHANPRLVLNEPLLIIGRQARLDSGVTDLLGCDQFGNVVVCEVKIGRSGTASASEETILSQPQNYARSVSKFGYDDLNDLYQEYLTRLEEGEWNVDRVPTRGESLQSAVETAFGTDLAEHEFNIEQRMVVVAEEITRRTELNMHYLLEQGLHYQATEVQQFLSDDDSFLGTSVVVDYDLDRVRPKDRPSPAYPDLNAELIRPIFPDIQATVNAATVTDVFPEGFDTRGPALQSRHSDHPGGVLYYISPEPDSDRVTIGIHNMNELPDVCERIRAARDRFEDAGLTVKDNTRYNLVWKRWSVDTVDDVRDLQQDISEHYKRMVLLGHDVLVEAVDDRD